MAEAAPPSPPWSPSLRVALVHDWLNGMRGGEKVLEQMCHLFPKADVFTLFYEPNRVSQTIRRRNVIEHPWAGQFPLLRRHYRKVLPLLPRMAESLPTAKYDLVLATSHCVAKAAAAPARGAKLAYVFSPMRYVWDHFEDYLGGGRVQDAALRRLRPRLQEWDRASSQSIDSIVSDSDHIARKVRRYWGRRSGTIYPHVDLEKFVPSHAPAEEHFLVVSALVPYKKVDRAIKAARLAGKRLVIVGNGPERARLEALADGADVRFLGWTADADLPAAYQSATALLYPNAEDFGITALEAQACGRPVIALRHGGATETVVDGVTGAFFDEPTAESLAAAMLAFHGGGYDPVAIRAHAEGFSAEAFREQVTAWVSHEVALRC